MGSSQFFHSVTLDKDKCRGCTYCIQRCPTEAIRVRDGKAKIIKERCIDCGQCIRICPHHAKQPIFDPLSVMDNFAYKIALPAPSLYGQFNNMDDIDLILAGLKAMGFDDVFEVSAAAEIVSDITRRMMNEPGALVKPVISSACPAVVRLIRVRFPELIPNLLPVHAPVEVAARLAKKQAHERLGIDESQIGAIFISPCPAKVTAVKMPLGTEKSAVDAVVAVRDVYKELISIMPKIQNPPDLLSSGRMGIGWSSSGGEASATLNEKYLSSDGIENIIKVLEDLEDEKLHDLDFVELDACSGGCVGGVLNVENPYIARTKLKKIRKYLPVSRNRIEGIIPPDALFDHEVEYAPVLQLDSDFGKSMEMLAQMSEVESHLGGVDCGACGAPSCRAMAEDIIRGFSTEEMCIYKIKEQLQKLNEELDAIKAKPAGAKPAPQEKETASHTALPADAPAAKSS